MRSPASPTPVPAATSRLERDLDDAAARPEDAALRARIAAHGLDVLPALEAHLACDLPIDALEGYEAVLKAVLRREMAGMVSGAAARAIAEFQRRVGLLLKYKSYAVKASSPLGYSIFLQNPAEGFSFQRHLTHKTEVFHILDVLPGDAAGSAGGPGGFVFLCTGEQWERVYDRERFAAWLAGERDEPDYERYRIPARPGDVFVLDQLGIVHTVVGCILEEFATVSTDMVDRLHDQNQGRPIPPAFTRDLVSQRLHTLRTPAASRLVVPSGATGEVHIEALPPIQVAGGTRTTLADGFVVATLHQIDPGAESDPTHDPCRATSLYVRQGTGQALLGTAAELAAGALPAIPLAATNLLTIPPGIHYSFVNDGRAPLHLVEHRIRPEVALF
jgi:mannose-6-phosphate isomerase-like protein (cupin superfamily)